MKHLLLFLILCNLVFSVFAQSFNYRKYRHEWEPGSPKEIPVEEVFKDQDAVILDDKLIYLAAGNQVPPQQYIVLSRRQFYIDETTSGPSPIVHRHMRIKYLTREGVKNHSTFILPESFDPASDWSTVRPESRDSIHRPKGEFECIRFFAARILREDGTIRPAILDEKIQTEINRTNKINSQLYSWIFRVINIEEGDELEVVYSYEGAFNFDPSTRIFFNSMLPKQSFHLTFRYPASEYNIITYANGALPYDSIMETKSHPKYKEYYFQSKNLSGGIREPGGRPHTQYPYINFYRHNREFGIVDPKTKFVTRPLPYPWSYVGLGLVGFREQNKKLRYSQIDRTTRRLNDFYARERAKAKDTSFAAMATSIHHTLASEFDYQDDYEYYAGDDGENENLGKYIENKVIRQRSRHRLYKELFDRFDRDYYRVLLCDKRISDLDMNEYKPSTSFRTAFAVPAGNQFIYFYPKSYRFGYETNELPFYYEDIQTLLIPQREPWEESLVIAPEVNFTFVRTPFSGVKDNIRITTAQVAVSLDSLIARFDARIRLSGQFSTLLRGYYLYGEKDSTINPLYFNAISNIAEDPRTVRTEVTSASQIFPFNASITSAFSTRAAITRITGREYEIDLYNWFNNVIDETFTSRNRQLNYYPDFQFQDSHKYILKFGRKIELMNADAFTQKISNGFADYTVSVTQNGDDSILIEAIYVVKPEYAPANRAADVEQVFNAIRKMNEASVMVKVL